MSRLSLALYGGSRDGNDPAFAEEARVLGNLVGRHDVLLKYGGSAKGLMGAFARGFVDAVRDYKSDSELFGVMPHKYFFQGDVEALGFKYSLTETMSERKAYFVRDTKAFIVLPGGTGTLDEIFESVEIDHNVKDSEGNRLPMRPIYILNTKGYYNKLFEQLKHSQNLGFISSHTELDYFHAEETPQGLYERMKRDLGL
ncbi:MAG: LOG family protein [Micavibrio sp.]